MNNTPKFRHLFIVTYGRSGSTLLQGILNKSPKIHLSGENGNLLFHMYEMLETLRATKDMVGQNKHRTPKDPFFGVDFYNESEIMSGIEGIFDKQILNSNIEQKEKIEFLGFKEIRIPYINDLQKFLKFVEKVFYDSRFIFCFRSMNEVLYSGMFADLTAESRIETRKIFNKFEKSARKYCESQENSVAMEFEKFRSDAEYIRNRLLMIGVDIDVETITKTMSVPHSYTWKGKSLENKNEF